MNYDPKLKEAAAKIEAICEQYDCGAYVSLISRTHGEFRFVFPTWTGLRYEADELGNLIARLKCKKSDGDFPEKAELTAHFLHSVQDTVGQAFLFVDGFIQVTKEKWNTEHKPFHNFRPHSERH